jgi:hypothetical protein
LATKVFIIPIGGSALAAVILPALTAWVIISAAGMLKIIIIYKLVYN